MDKMKIRTIITQDAEVDDQNSLRHFLFYANEVELQGIVQTSSCFHWKGIPGAVRPEVNLDGHDSFKDAMEGSFDQPYRWPGTDWMFRVIDDYEKDYPNLIRHAEGYPTPEYLRGITKIGNIGYKGETEAPTEGSELIRKAMLDDDGRTLYLQVWGGCNTIARALMDIQSAHENTPEWPALRERLTKKIVITACGEQDETFRTYIAEEWPGILFVKTLQMCSYAYFWFTMPEGESKDTLRAEFMKREILSGGSALAGGYCTWKDGNRYEGESESGQFGTNPNIEKEWFGAKVSEQWPARKYDFLSEGDSPTFFALFDWWGFRSLENFAWGGIAGRYHRVMGEMNSKGEPLNIWNVSNDAYTDGNGETQITESMWPYVADIQRDFAARTAWAAADTFEKGEHAPILRIREGLDLTAGPGEEITLHAEAAARDRFEVKTVFRVYPEPGAAWSSEVSPREPEAGTAVITIPGKAVSGEQLHIIVKAESAGHYRLTRYQQVIITVK